MFLRMSGRSWRMMPDHPKSDEKVRGTMESADKNKTATFILGCVIFGGAVYWALEAALPLTPLKPGHGQGAGRLEGRFHA